MRGRGGSLTFDSEVKERVVAVVDCLALLFRLSIHPFIRPSVCLVCLHFSSWKHFQMWSFLRIMLPTFPNSFRKSTEDVVKTVHKINNDRFCSNSWKIVLIQLRSLETVSMVTGIDLSKLLGGKPRYWGAKGFDYWCIGVSNNWEHAPRLSSPKSLRLCIFRLILVLKIGSDLHHSLIMLEMISILF